MAIVSKTKATEPRLDDEGGSSRDRGDLRLHRRGCISILIMRDGNFDCLQNPLQSSQDLAEEWYGS